MTNRLNNARLGLQETVKTRQRLIDEINRQMDDDEWRRINDIRTELERPIIAEMDAIFREQEEEVLRALDTFRDFAGSQRNILINIESLFDAPGWIVKTWQRLRGYIYRSLVVGYEVGGVQASIDLDDLSELDPNIRKYMEIAQRKTENITGTTRRQIDNIVHDALRNGKGIDFIAREISDKFEQFGKSRSMAIAQTSVTAAFGRGQIEAFKVGGFDKGWLSRRDGRVRETHTIADGQEKPLNSPFEVGKALLMYPADPETDRLEEIMGCRCTMFPVMR